MPGRQSRALSLKDVRRLKEFQSRERLSVPQFKLAMDAPFKWGVLQRALDGEPVWVLNYNFIVEWLDKHCPENAAPELVDGKSAAAGERISQDGD